MPPPVPRGPKSRRQSLRTRVGDAFELGVEAACTFYRNHTPVFGGGQVRYVHRLPGQPAAAVFTRSHAKAKLVRGQLRYVQKGGVDFVGWYAVDSRVRTAIPCAFDCKLRTDEASFAIDLKNPTDANQLTLLRDWAEGGIAFYLVGDRKANVAWAVFDLEALARGERVTLCSRRNGRIHTHALPAISGVPFWDFLQLVPA